MHHFTKLVYAERDGSVIVASACDLMLWCCKRAIYDFGQGQSDEEDLKIGASPEYLQGLFISDFAGWRFLVTLVPTKLLSIT